MSKVEPVVHSFSFLIVLRIRATAEMAVESQSSHFGRFLASVNSAVPCLHLTYGVVLMKIPCGWICSQIDL